MGIDVRKAIIVAAALWSSLVCCEPPALSNQYGVPGNYAGGNSHGSLGGSITNSYGAPLGTGHDEHQDYIDSQPKSYEFGYNVKDVASGNDFGRRETSDGETVRGEYRVQLPDGRTQIVTYTADWRTGFHADVRYEGVASYPQQYNANGFNNNPSGYDYNQNNNIDANYHNADGNQGGFNNYQGAERNSNYNYQYGSNSIDNSNYNGYGPPPPPPQQAYGAPYN